MEVQSSNSYLTMARGIAPESSRCAQSADPLPGQVAVMCSRKSLADFLECSTSSRTIASHMQMPIGQVMQGLGHLFTRNVRLPAKLVHESVCLEQVVEVIGVKFRQHQPTGKIGVAFVQLAEQFFFCRGVFAGFEVLKRFHIDGMDDLS